LRLIREEFTLINVTYPTEVSGEVAPGMEVLFDILFKANSLSDYQDELIIISEKNNFTVGTILTTDSSYCLQRAASTQSGGEHRS
jgi:hypothetical protein